MSAIRTVAWEAVKIVAVIALIAVPLARPTPRVRAVIASEPDHVQWIAPDGAEVFTNPHLQNPPKLHLWSTHSGELLKTLPLTGGVDDRLLYISKDGSFHLTGEGDHYRGNLWRQGRSWTTIFGWKAVVHFDWFVSLFARDGQLKIVDKHSGETLASRDGHPPLKWYDYRCQILCRAAVAGQYRSFVRRSDRPHNLSHGIVEPDHPDHGFLSRLEKLAGTEQHRDLPILRAPPLEDPCLVTVVDLTDASTVFRLTRDNVIYGDLSEDGRVLVLREKTGFTCWDVPAKRPIGFALSVALGVWLTMTVLEHGRRFWKRDRAVG